MNERIRVAAFSVVLSVFGVTLLPVADAVEFAESEDVANCQRIERQVCSTKRSNGYFRCAQWHERYANRSGATHIVITEYVERGSFLFMGSADRMQADYFNCPGNTVEAPNKPRPATEEVVRSGSGFFITNECHLVTNHHVVDGSDKVSVTLHSGDMFEMEVVGSDPSNDIAILKGECQSTPIPLKNTFGSLKGQDVFTIGYPLVQLQGTEQKVSFGHINADSGIQGDIRFLQIDVPVQPGNSGGPLVDEHGNVVGIVTARLDALLTLQATGSLPQNVNYAIKIDYLFPLLRYTKIEPDLPSSEKQISTISAIADTEKSVGMVKAITVKK